MAIPAATAGNPKNRQFCCHKHNQIPPNAIKLMANTGMVAIPMLAPGQPATQEAIFNTSSMPAVIPHSGIVSSPSGKASIVSNAIGMTKVLTTGIANRLPAKA